MELLGQYRNGNYDVLIYEDGTKIRQTEEDSFEPAFSESIDCKITNRCYGQCAFCHENSTPDGDHGDILNAKFIDTLRPYTEIAIGGGCPLLHPDLGEFHIGHFKKSATQHLKYIPRNRLGLFDIAWSFVCVNSFNSSFVFA